MYADTHEMEGGDRERRQGSTEIQEMEGVDRPRWKAGIDRDRARATSKRKKVHNLSSMGIS